MNLRHGATRDLLACWFGVDRSTITRVIGEMRPLLAQRGCTVPSGVRLHTLAEVIEHLGTSKQTDIIEGTEIRVRRRPQQRPPQELAVPRPSPRPPRAHKQHRPSGRRSPVTPVDRHSAKPSLSVNTRRVLSPRRATAYRARGR
ncbi:transposase family protein [Streptomyces sp. NBC_00081]